MIRIIATSLFFSALLFSACKSDNIETKTLDQKSTVSDQSAIRISEEPANSAEPAIAADSKGNIFVAYVEHEAKAANVYLQKLDRDAKPVGEKVRVNPEKGNATSWFGDAPTIQIGHDDVIYLGWTAKDPNAGKSNSTVLNLSVSRDNGMTFGSPVKVNDDAKPSAHGMHSLAIDKDNRVVMAWLDERNIKPMDHAAFVEGDLVVDPNQSRFAGGFEFTRIHNGEDHSKKEKPTTKVVKQYLAEESDEPNSEVFSAVSNDGGRTFSKNRKVSSEVCPCCKTNLAIDEKGKIYASWRQVLPGSFRHIAVASSENGGENFSDYSIVSDDQWEISACPVSGAPMFIDKDNNLKIFWYTAGKAGKPGLYTAVSNDGGKSFLARSLVYEGAVKGTLSVFSKSEREFGVFFDGMGEVFQVDQSLSPSQKFEGELPAAVFANGSTYVAFVKKSDDKSGIWIQIY